MPCQNILKKARRLNIKGAEGGFQMLHDFPLIWLIGSNCVMLIGLVLSACKADTLTLIQGNRELV